jgi:hypothetical protein
MPRRSAADLTLVPLVPGRGRPEPPKALDQVEARAWNDVVGRCHVHGILLVDPAARSEVARRKIKQLEASRWEQIPPKTAYSLAV